MTDQSELTQSLAWLAGEAGYEVVPWMKHGPRKLVARKGGDGGEVIVLPGADGTLRLEDVGLVETWLLDAGYMVSVFDMGKPSCSIVHQTKEGGIGEGDSLEAALAEAVKALHKAS